jgi:uncharacterized protein YggE
MLSKKKCVPWMMVLFTAWASTELLAAEPLRKVTVSAKAEIDIVPNEVLIRLVVETQKNDLLEAKAENDRITRAVLALGPQHGVPDEQFTLTNLEMQPVLEKSRGGKYVLVGYAVRRSIEVSVRDFAKLEPVLSDAVKAGVTRVNSLLFRSRRPREEQARVRCLAVQFAKEKAEQLAELNGLALGAPLSIEADTDDNDQVWGMAGMAAANSPPGPPRFQLVAQKTNGEPAPKSNVTPDGLLAPGTITIEARVTITFEMVERPR